MAITLFLAVLAAIITLYQNLYKNIDDKSDKVKIELRQEYEKSKKSLDDEKEKINKFTEDLESLINKFDLRDKIVESIQNIKDSYADFYTKTSSGNHSGLITELVRLEKILRCLASDDSLKVTQNLKFLLDFLLNPKNKFEKTVFDYLYLLHQNKKFENNEAAMKFYKEKIVEGFYGSRIG